MTELFKVKVMKGYVSLVAQPEEMGKTEYKVYRYITLKGKNDVKICVSTTYDYSAGKYSFDQIVSRETNFRDATVTKSDKGFRVHYYDLATEVNNRSFATEEEALASKTAWEYSLRGE